MPNTIYYLFSTKSLFQFKHRDILSNGADEFTITINEAANVRYRSLNTLVIRKNLIDTAPDFGSVFSQIINFRNQIIYRSRHIH